MTGQQVLLGKDPLGNDLPEKDLLEKGFQLAYFILPDRAAAVQVVTRAMNKLKAQRGRESRRTYWRDKHLKRGITRITRDEQDALQWLIFYEADQYEAGQLASGPLQAEHQQPDRLPPDQHEASQEKSGQQTLRSLVVRYIVNLVRMTTAMSSFHVNVGMHRLLHNYSTAETQRVYEAITERYLGADEYRRAKSVLMAKLEKRFGDLLRTVRTQHGEMRFEAEVDQTRWAALVDSCLKMFTPWSTHQDCPVPTNYDASREKPPARLSGKGLDRIDPNEIEINRCHAFIDPVCYSRLMHALTFDAPSTRLALPRFFMDTNNSDSNNSPQTARLSPEERKQITDQLSAQEKKRSGAAPRMVAVVVDGVERGRLDLGHLRECSFEIEEGAELIELRMPGEGEDLLLAVHPVLYQETEGMAASQATLFRKGLRKLDLRIVPGPQAAQGPRHALVTLRYVSNPFSALWSPSTRSPTWRLAPVYSATALALVALGWALGTVRHKVQVRPQSPSVQVTPAKAVEQVPPAKIVEQATAVAPPNVTARAARYALTLVPDESRLRGAGSADIPTVSVPSHPVVIELALPVSAAYARKSFHASLQRFLKPPVILTANMLKAQKTSSGNVVVLPLPSVLLDDREDYLVDLRALGSGGEFEEISTYTFHAEKKP